MNDTKYGDFQTSFDPLGPDAGLAVPNTVRDNVTDRRHADDCIEQSFATGAFGNARIDGDPVVVSSPQVPRPVKAIHAWSDYPACSLYNKANLPAFPCRPDGT